MKTEALERSNEPYAARRVRVKGKPKVILDEADYESLLRRADLWEPELPAQDASGNYPALEALAVIQARSILSVPAASWGYRRRNWPAAPAFGPKRSIASNKAGTSRACPPSPRSTAR